MRFVLIEANFRIKGNADKQQLMLWMCVFAYFCIIVFLHQHWQNIRSWLKFFSGCTTATLHYNTWPAWVEFWTSLLSGSKTFCFHFDWWYYHSERSWAVIERRLSKCATLNYVHFISALHRWYFMSNLEASVEGKRSHTLHFNILN